MRNTFSCFHTLLPPPPPPLSLSLSFSISPSYFFSPQQGNKKKHLSNIPAPWQRQLSWRTKTKPCEQKADQVLWPRATVPERQQTQWKNTSLGGWRPVHNPTCLVSGPYWNTPVLTLVLTRYHLHRLNFTCTSPPSYFCQHERHEPRTNNMKSSPFTGHQSRICCKRRMNGCDIISERGDKNKVSFESSRCCFWKSNKKWLQGDRSKLGKTSACDRSTHSCVRGRRRRFDLLLG